MHNSVSVTAKEGNGAEMHLWIARANEAFKVGLRCSIYVLIFGDGFR